MINLNSKLYRIKKYLILVIIFLLNLNILYGIGIYDDEGQCKYFVNTNNPTISINISSPTEEIYIEKAVITYNNSNYTYDIPSKIMSLYPSDGIKEYKFTKDMFNNLHLFETGINSSKFKLYAHRINDDKLITPIGDPIDFYIIYDTKSPFISNIYDENNENVNSNNNNNNNNENNYDAIIHINPNNQIEGEDYSFSEPIAKYNIYLNGVLFESNETDSNKLSDYINSVYINFSKLNLNEGNNLLKIEFWDLAGNYNSSNISITYIGENLKLYLLTIQNDSSLKYNYDINKKELFSGTIYSKDENFELKVKTSKMAKCYFSSSLSDFGTFSKLPSNAYKEMNSNDNITHSININTDNKKIWVYCRNIFYSDDDAYLSSSMGLGNSLINISLFTGDSIKILSILPNNIVTSIPFTFEVKTNNKGICYYLKDSSTQIKLNSNDFLTHSIEINNLNDGSYNFNFKCFDVLDNYDEKTMSLKINTSSGVKITSYSPKFTGSSSTNINFTLSEIAECKYSKQDNQEQNYDSLNPISNEGINKEFQINSLIEGNNSIFIYCKKGVVVYKNKINVFYDSNPPRIENFTFINNGVESDFLSSYDKMEFKFDVISSIPIERNYLIYSNGGVKETKIFHNTHAVFNMNLSNISSIAIISEDKIGRNSSKIEKNLQFDINKPNINFEYNFNKIKINCVDSESGCELVKYGLSKTSECFPSIVYNSNDTIKAGDNIYVCAKAFDNAGNDFYKKEVIKIGFNNFLNNNSNLNNSNNQTGNINPSLNNSSNSGYIEDNFDNNNDNENEDEQNNDVENTDDPWSSNNSNENKTSGINYLLIGALALLIITVSGGSYYAYKKGYLNNELKKLGFKIPEDNKNKNQNNKNPYFNSNFKNNTGLNKNSQNKPNYYNRNDKYNQHLNKLHSFIDSEMNKSESLFDKFKSKPSLAKKEFGDTLIKPKSPISDLSQEDFDDVYKSSKEIDSLDKYKTSKKEAETFEEFYKKNKSNKKSNINLDNIDIANNKDNKNITNKNSSNENKNNKNNNDKSLKSKDNKTKL